MNIDIDAIRENGKLKKQKGDWAEALLDFEVILQTVRTQSELSDHIRSSLYHSAECLLNLGLAEESANRFKLCLRVCPDHLTAPKLLKQALQSDNSKDGLLQGIDKFTLDMIRRSNCIVEATIEEIEKERQKQSASSGDKIVYNRQKIPCHLKQLYVRWDGSIFPCCLCWSRPSSIICNLKDPELENKIHNYSLPCQCERYQLRPGVPAEKDYGRLNIEMSLACNGKCAMCCVDAPAWKGKYDLYDDLYRLVEFCNPKEILVQGGEILIQKKSLTWLDKVRKKYPDIRIDLVTNGNVSTDMVEQLEFLFDGIVISILGFQPETYERIMELDFHKTKILAEALIERGNVDITLKYLYSPLSLHEIPLFIQWMSDIKAKSSVIKDASTDWYINRETSDNYWNKLFTRTAKSIKSTLGNNRQAFQQNSTKLGFDTKSREHFGIDEQYINSNNLNDILYWYKT